MSSQDTAGKKRKRQAESQPRPAKRAAHALPGGQVKIKHLPRDDEWAPIVASTPGLVLPEKASFQAYARTSSKHDRQNELLLQSSDHATVTYTARQAQVGSADGLLQHYIGVFDPSTNALELVPASKMSIRSSLRAEDDETRVQQVAQTATMTDRRRVLGEEFGTKKAKKALNSLRENAVNSSTRGTSPDSIAKAIKNDAAAQAVLEAVAANADKTVSRQAMQAAVDADKPRPKHNPDAKSVEQVYTAEELVGRDMLQALKVKPWVEATLQDEEIPTSSRFVSHRITELVSKRSDDEDGAITRLKCCKYMLVLLEFYGACTKLRGGGRKLPPRDKLVAKVQAEPGVLQKAIKLFSKDGEMTKKFVDKLIMHLCAISLIVDYYETDTFDLREDLGLGTQDFNKYFAEIGARVSSMTDVERQRRRLTKAEASVHKVVRLKLPLEFPKERVAPRRKNAR